jgi:hypothetical protein
MMCRKCKKNEVVIGRKTCSNCLLWQANYRARNREKRNLSIRAWRSRNKSKLIVRRSELYSINADKRRRQALIYRQQLKQEVLRHYSGGTMKCALCPEARIGALTIDHINGGGSTHRQSISKIYFWLRKNSYPSGYRVLCANCNWKEYVSNIGPRSARNTAIKKRFMNYIGGQCKECGKTDLDILTVHHTNNNGAEHRRQICGGKKGSWFYKAILRTFDFNGLECLCLSCNDLKEWTVCISSPSGGITPIPDQIWSGATGSRRSATDNIPEIVLTNKTGFSQHGSNGSTNRHRPEL